MHDDIVITGVGMRTAVGNDAVQTCATVRTGISRFAEWPFASIGQVEEGVVVASLSPDLGDMPWIEKAPEMVEQPLHEALWQARLYDTQAYRAQTQNKSKIGAYLAMPSAGRVGVESRAEREFMIEAKVHCIAPASADMVEIIPMDQAAGLVAVARATQALSEGKIGVAVIGAIDSHLHSPWLEALHEAKRLKHGDVSVGLVPGEACAFLVLEKRAHAQGRGAQPLAALQTVAVDQEPNPIGPDHPIRAEGLTRAVQACLTSSSGADVHRVIVDHNGERWRALEWALVETRCLGELAKGWQLWHPSDCFGDVGAASALVSLGIATRAFARGYGGEGAILLACASWGGERAAAVVQPAG